MISVCVLCEHAADTVSANVKKGTGLPFLFFIFYARCLWRSEGVWEFGRVPEKQNNITETIHVHSDSSSSYLHSAT